MYVGFANCLTHISKPVDKSDVWSTKVLSNVQSSEMYASVNSFQPINRTAPYHPRKV